MPSTSACSSARITPPTRTRLHDVSLQLPRSSNGHSGQSACNGTGAAATAGCERSSAGAKSGASSRLLPRLLLHVLC